MSGWAAHPKRAICGRVAGLVLRGLQGSVLVTTRAPRIERHPSRETRRLWRVSGLGGFGEAALADQLRLTIRIGRLETLRADQADKVPINLCDLNSSTANATSTVSFWRVKINP
jgi:hypothetical protein